MKRQAKRPAVWLFVSFVSFVFPSSLHAQAPTFESVGVRARGMAGAFVAVADDATAVWWNPAGLAYNSFFDATLEFGRAADPPRTRAGGFATKVLNLGLSYYRLQLREIRAAGPVGPGPVNREDQAVLGLFGLTTAQSLGDHLVVGSTLRVAHAGETHLDYDAGVMVTGGGARLGLTMRHLTAPSFGSGAGQFELTRQVRTGVALTGAGRGGVDGLTLALDADLTRTPTPFGDARHIAAGAEAWVMARRVGLRGGISASTVGAANPSLSGGVSLGLLPGMFLDGSLTGGSDQSLRGWAVDLRVTF